MDSLNSDLVLEGGMSAFRALLCISAAALPVCLFVVLADRILQCEPGVLVCDSRCLLVRMCACSREGMGRQPLKHFRLGSLTCQSSEDI